MKLFLLCLGILNLILVVISLVWIEICYPKYVRNKGAKNTGSLKLDRPVSRWKIELVDMTNGNKITKFFSDMVVLGRTLGMTESANQCFLGDKQTISRMQCIIRVYGMHLVIENLSQVNITRHNRRLLLQPYYLRQGDALAIGGSEYLVSRLEYFP